MSESPDKTSDETEEVQVDETPTEETDQEPVESADTEEAGQEAEPVEPMTPLQIAATVEAILFSTDTPMTEAKILQVAELSSKRDVTDAIDILNDRYEDSGSAFRIEKIAGGYRLQTLETYHQVLSRLFKAKSESKLSQPAMETLSIVAYRQPVLRADIEAIRGVACGEVLRGLMEKLLIKIVGRAEVIGRPMLYGTTRRFLEVFGLASLNDLPRADELRQAPEKKAPSPPPQAEEEDQTAEDQTDDAEDAEAPAETEQPAQAEQAEQVEQAAPADEPADEPAEEKVSD